ncbi:GNAT family N-acetyltransferase [Mesorhizobium sp. B2-5-4]|uniref:GNAT family N-acetyltransferase n=1 Tax=unclassified Mesorhizobium TaxID=325217 RepID=UPI0011279F04|nr:MULTISPECIES: GNAT family N-acetyltransferase [unclassified Mesorhizobium]TPK41918.1 GNAT family N-acetyltransferase [Mesorhizobium sp. B2-5-4]TPL73273.1 GNAT family N-acetyltransferase [Mesorhizobium sp. B2-3-13]
MANLTILPVSIASDLGALALEVRRKVFIVEQNVPETVERDAYDAEATHVVAIDGGDVVGTLRIVFLTEHAKFGRVAVLRQARGNGIAMRMMQAGMQIARSRGENRFYLTSQTDKTALYEKLGFVACGDEFEEAGIPHRAMKNY